MSLHRMRVHPRPVEAVEMHMMVAAEIGWHDAERSRGAVSWEGAISLLGL